MDTVPWRQYPRSFLPFYVVFPDGKSDCRYFDALEEAVAHAINPSPWDKSKDAELLAAHEEHKRKHGFICRK